MTTTNSDKNEELRKMHLELTLACRKEALRCNDKPYIRRCNRLLKSLMKGRPNECKL